MKKCNCGFTLIELILIIVLFGITTSFLAPFMGSALLESHSPVDNLSDASDLSSEMAKLISEYKTNNNGIETLKSSAASIVDTTSVTIDYNDYVKFGTSGSGFIEQAGNSTDVEILKIKISSKKNPGEKLSYYFTADPS